MVTKIDNNNSFLQFTKDTTLKSLIEPKPIDIFGKSLPLTGETTAAAEQFKADGLLAKSRVFGIETIAATSVSTAGNTPPQSKAEWQQRALERAGINPAQWNPSRGFGENRQNVERVYALYANLYSNHTELQWSGMAKLAGGVVYGGLQQIDTNEERAITGGGILSAINPALGISTTTVALSELNFMEGKLLTMQKEIFTDLAWQHIAYTEGGIKALESAYQRNEITEDNLNAWRDIASGNENRILRGNKWLLHREQFDILQKHYNDIRSRPGTGGIFSTALSQLAESPIPKGHSFSSSVGGDITVFADRWKWVENEVLKPYQNLSLQHRAVLNNQSLQDLANRRFVADPLAPKPQPHPTPTPNP